MWAADTGTSLALYLSIGPKGRTRLTHLRKKLMSYEGSVFQFVDNSGTVAAE